MSASSPPAPAAGRADNRGHRFSLSVRFAALDRTVELYDFFFALDSPILTDGYGFSTPPRNKLRPVMPWTTSLHLSLGSLVQTALATFGLAATSCECFAATLDARTVTDDHVCTLSLPGCVRVEVDAQGTQATAAQLAAPLLYAPTSVLVVITAPPLLPQPTLPSPSSNPSAAQTTGHQLLRDMKQAAPKTSVTRCAITRQPGVRQRGLEAVYIVPKAAGDSLSQLVALFAPHFQRSAPVDPHGRVRAAFEAECPNGLALMDPQISPPQLDHGVESLENGIWLVHSARQSFDTHRFAILHGRLLPLDDFVPWHLDATAWVSGIASDDPRYETLDRLLDTYRKERRALSLTAAETDLVRYSVKPGCIEADVEQWLLFHLRAVYDIYEAYRPKGTRKALEEIFGIAKSGPRADIAGQGFVDFCQLAFKTRTMLDLRGDGQVAPDPTGTEENAGSLASNDDDGDDGDEDDDARTVTPRLCHCHRGGDENSADEDDDDDQEAEMGRGFVDFFQLASNARAMLGPR